MDFDELENIMNEIYIKLNSDSPKYYFFKTESGKQFENQFKELIEFTNLTNVLSNIPIFYVFFNEFLSKIKTIDYIDYMNKLSNNQNLTENETAEIRNKISNLFVETLNSHSLGPEIKDNISSFLERINSYFFLAFYAYLDVYVDSIYETLKLKLDSITFQKLEKKYQDSKKINDQLNAIKNSLSLISITKLGRILKNKTWKESFDTLIDRRHFMAHEEPLARYQMLNQKFEKVVIRAKAKVSTFFQNNGIDQIKNMLDELNPNFIILFSLIEIGKDCYSYLALIDILIAKYLEINNPNE